MDYGYAGSEELLRGVGTMVYNGYRMERGGSEVYDTEARFLLEGYWEEIMPNAMVIVARDGRAIVQTGFSSDH